MLTAYCSSEWLVRINDSINEDTDDIAVTVMFRIRWASQELETDKDRARVYNKLATTDLITSLFFKRCCEHWNKNKL